MRDELGWAKSFTNPMEVDCFLFVRDATVKEEKGRGTVRIGVILLF